MASRVVVAYTGRKEMATQTLEWTIADFEEKTKTAKTGEMIKLEDIEVGETKWYFELYPAGATTDEKDAVSIFCYSKNDAPTTAKMLFSINNIFYCWDNFTHNFEVDTENDWGYPKFIMHNAKNFQKLLVNGELMLGITIIVYGEEETTIKVKDCQNLDAIEVTEKMKLGKDLKECWMNDEFSDVQIKCDGVIFYCHRIILAKRSAHFRTMLEGKFKESQTRIIEIKEMDVDTLRAILKYIYSGELGNMETNAMSLMEASDRFDMPELKQICENYLIGNYIKIENIIDTLLMADLHKAKMLKKAAMDMIVANSDAVIKQEGWKAKLERASHLFCEIFEAIAAKK